MTKIHLEEYQVGFKQDNLQKEERGELKRSTVRQRRYAVDELVAWFEYHEKVLDTDDYFKSTDNLREFSDRSLHTTLLKQITDPIPILLLQIVVKLICKLRFLNTCIICRWIRYT